MIKWKNNKVIRTKTIAKFEVSALKKIAQVIATKNVDYTDQLLQKQKQLLFVHNDNQEFLSE